MRNLQLFGRVSSLDTIETIGTECNRAFPGSRPVRAYGAQGKDFTYFVTVCFFCYQLFLRIS